MRNLVALPLVIPFLCAALSILAPGNLFRRALALAGTALTLAAAVVLLVDASSAGVLVLEAGGWPAPFGIVLVCDRLAALMLAISAFVAFCCAVFSLADVGRADTRGGFHTFFHVLLGGVNGAFLAGDLFNLFVWFEVMLLASFVMISAGGSREQIGGGMKYVTLNLISSALFLTGIGLLYGKAGTLNMADLAVKLASPADQQAMTPAASLIFLAFGIKAGLFPLYSWLPASYHTPLPTVTALFAGLLTKVGVYAFMRLFTLVFPVAGAPLGGLLLGLSLLTMVLGVFGAASQMNARRILSFHIISQIGYITAGLALGTPAAIAASIFYTIHNIAAKTGLLIIAGIVEHTAGSGALERLGGLWKSRPFLSFLFAASALALAGVPPLSGFWAKLLLIQSAISNGAVLTAFTALFVGMFTLYSMMKIWNEVFLKTPPAGEPSLRKTPFVLFVPAVLFAGLTLYLSFAPEGLITFAQSAAGQLADPSEYVSAVLRPSP